MKRVKSIIEPFVRRLGGRLLMLPKLVWSALAVTETTSTSSDDEE